MLSLNVMVYVVVGPAGLDDATAIGVPSPMIPAKPFKAACTAAAVGGVVAVYASGTVTIPLKVIVKDPPAVEVTANVCTAFVTVPSRSASC